MLKSRLILQWCHSIIIKGMKMYWQTKQIYLSTASIPQWVNILKMNRSLSMLIILINVKLLRSSDLSNSAGSDYSLQLSDYKTDSMNNTQITHLDNESIAYEPQTVVDTTTSYVHSILERSEGYQKLIRRIDKYSSQKQLVKFDNVLKTDFNKRILKFKIYK